MNLKSTLIALSAVAALAIGASAAAQAKVRFDINIDLPTYAPIYVTDGYGYEPECHYVTVKVVKWVYGHKVIKWKQKLVCSDY